MEALRALLRDLIDYAGLFPPAGLPLDEAAATYAAERRGRDAWALGRLIVPAARLGELAALLPADPGPAGPWPISALAADLAADLSAIAAFNRAQAGRALVDALELRADAAAPLLAGGLAPLVGLTVYVELPLEQDPAPAIGRLAALGVRAKARCGGVTADAFPEPEALLRFLKACVDAGLPCKATAGLHHPLRGAYRLTYEPGSPRAPMYGFLNLLLAMGALRSGAAEATAHALLLEDEPQALAWDDDGVTWRGELRLGRAELAALRADGLIAVGSCSFREPVDEIAQLYGAL